ncbi:Na+/H+ antiporter subunit A [Virgibacillus siamensis]|uniref:Na+/H+ antiporter subunit A n=1 Tax=Virgibacillus siamensis TaxID=480071 RepID=UPI00158F0964|nr:Na+/H+ antiporter subunit A [Virgibacillus siamensis]
MLTMHAAIIIPFIVAALIPFLAKRLKTLHIGWFVLLVPFGLFLLLTSYIPMIARGETISQTIHWIPNYDINFTTYLDGLSMILALLITGIGTLVVLYSIYYLSPEESLKHFFVFLLLFMGAMLGVVLSDNILVLYVFWELTSISSFLLIAFWYHRKKSREGAQKSLLITVSGGFAMLVGFIMLYVMTGTFSVQEIIHEIPKYTNHILFLPALVLILIGAFTKSAQFPFHIWLPDAMEAPTPVSAYLHSATMVKAGIYLVARFTPVFGGEALWFWLVGGIGLLTLFWGSFNAVKQTDLKALLAYSTVSQLGMIMTMFGIGSAALYFGYSTESVIYTQATFAALFHLVNHSTFKGALFMVVGIVDHEVGTRDIRRLGGLVTLMPITFTISLIGSFSMAGLPPFNGFISKEMFFTSVLHIGELNIFSMDTWGILFPVIAWIASVFTFIYSMIIVFKTFFGPYQLGKLERPAHEPPLGMLIAPSVLGLMVVGLFFFPNVLGNNLLKPAMAGIFPTFPADRLDVEIKAWHGFNMELFMTFGVAAVGTLMYVALRYWKGIYRLAPEKWTFNELYSFALDQLEIRSRVVTDSYMTGFLRDYFIYIFLFFSVLIGGTLIYTGAIDFGISSNAPISVYEWILAVVMVVAGISILFAKSRLTAILLNGVLGYSIAVFFVLFRDPDLALTQVGIETVTTVLFLVSYYFLPEWQKENTPKRKKGLNILISVSVGVVFILLALAVRSGKLFESISGYYENAYKLAGGKNIVNTILGDFRAFDTMLEVVVLLIAGIGVYSFVKSKSKKGGHNIEDQ